MKLAILTAVVSLAVMCVMGFQAFRQELHLKSLRAHVTETSLEIKKKESAIVEIKNQIQNVKNELTVVNRNIDEAKTKKEGMEKAQKEFEATLKNCNTEKGEAEKRATEITDSIAKVKADHEDARQKAEREIQSLKEQILDRDKAICAFVDTSDAEARKLCGISDALK